MKVSDNVRICPFFAEFQCRLFLRRSAFTEQILPDKLENVDRTVVLHSLMPNIPFLLPWNQIQHALSTSPESTPHRFGLWPLDAPGQIF
jgi:hypothetical protein